MPKKSAKPWPQIKLVTHKTGVEAWMIDARIGGRGSRLYRTTKAEAQTLGEQLRIKRRNEGQFAFEMPAHERIDAAAALSLLRPHNLNLQTAAEFALKHLVTLRRDVRLDELLTEVLASKETDGLTKVYQRNIKSVCNRFIRDYPGMKASEVSTQIVDDWLRSLIVAANTRNYMRNYLFVFFAHAVQRRYCLKNPVTDAVVAKYVDKPPGIFTPQQTARMLALCPPDFLAVVALGAFAGLRPLSEICRLDWSHIHFDEKLIDIAADRTKTAKKRFVTMQPNLVEWLLPIRKPFGPIVRSNYAYMKYQAALRKESGFKWHVDGLRHTFASMHFAHFKNAGDTAQQLGHAGLNMLYKHYRERVKPVEAAAFWNIRPGQQDNVIPMLATA